MKNLLIKELKLSMHPTAPMFLLLSSMLLIPNYPYYVIFFYTGLAVFFTCLNGRENKDVPYTMLLPVKKTDIVKARYLYVISLELLQILLAIPFAVIRQKFPVPQNQVGMEANIALFGLSLIMLGLFNVVFFKIYYKDVNKVGKAFVLSSTAVFGFMLVAELLTHIVPFFKNVLDTLDDVYVLPKLIVLAVGIAVYVVLTLISYNTSKKSFEVYDL